MGEATTHRGCAGGVPLEAQARDAVRELDLSSETNLIDALHQVQERMGYLPAPALEELSRRLGVRLSRVYSVVTFYEQFRTEPRGRHTVCCCRGTACHVGGGPALIEAVRNTLGVDDGETTTARRPQTVHSPSIPWRASGYVRLRRSWLLMTRTTGGCRHPTFRPCWAGSSRRSAGDSSPLPRCLQPMAS